MTKPNQTVETKNSVAGFLKTVQDDQMRADSSALSDLITKQTGLPARMWGPAIIGFGSYHYQYESGREGDAPLVSFSPRKNAISLYVSLDPEDRKKWLSEFGKHKSARFCIYFKRLADIRIPILRKMIAQSVERTKNRYKTV